MFVPVASATTAIHRDHHLVLASNAHQREMKPIVSPGQIISADLPLLMDGQIDNYNFSIMKGATLAGVVAFYKCGQTLMQLSSIPV